MNRFFIVVALNLVFASSLARASLDSTPNSAESCIINYPFCIGSTQLSFATVSVGTFLISTAAYCRYFGKEGAFAHVAFAAKNLAEQIGPEILNVGMTWAPSESAETSEFILELFEHQIPQEFVSNLRKIPASEFTAQLHKSPAFTRAIGEAVALYGGKLPTVLTFVSFKVRKATSSNGV